MTALAGSLRASVSALGRGVREARFYAALLLALVLWVAAYEVKQDYVVYVADLAYHPYIANFNDIETTTSQPPFRYRWSKANPEIMVPGIGNEPVQLSITTIGTRPSAQPPVVTVRVRGQSFTLLTRTQEHTDTFLVERGDSWNGDFIVSLSVPAFSPAGDPRELGVIIRSVAVRPAGYGLSPVVIPPTATLGLLLVSLVATYLFGLVTTRRRSTALILAALNILLVAVLIVVARPDLGFLAGQLPSLWAWGLLFGMLGRTMLDLSITPAGRWANFVAAAGSAAFAFAFMVRFGGLTNAQFLTSDLFLHIHNTEAVMRGEWLFTEPVPDGTLVPYPPAHYALVSALSMLVGSSEVMLGLLLKWTGSLLDAATCLAIAWAGWRLAAGPIGGMAALAYACAPGAFDLFSAGNYTNIFAQAVSNLTLLGGLVYINRRSASPGRVAPLLLVAGFGLTMLGHYGMMLGALAILALFGLWTIVKAIRKEPVGNASWLLLAAGVALAGSVALYYRYFLAEISTQWSIVLDKLAAGAPRRGSTAVGSPDFSQSLLKLPGKLFTLMGSLTVATGAFGAGLVVRLKPATRALLASWLLATVAFALLDQIVGDSVRWYYLGAAPLALLAAAFLGNLAGRSNWARALTALLLASMAVYMLSFWVSLIYTRYH